ncbi:hypothetical protein PFISCL1PPCAC_24456, partial [Pristionchus fissidentatus]
RSSRGHPCRCCTQMPHHATRCRRRRCNVRVWKCQLPQNCGRIWSCFEIMQSCCMPKFRMPTACWRNGLLLHWRSVQSEFLHHQSHPSSHHFHNLLH